MNIPNDPVILLSFINTKLRDEYPNLTELCKSMSINESSLINKLSAIAYHYEPSCNQFIT